MLAHPWVTGELALGICAACAEIPQLLGDLPQATVAAAPALLAFIEPRSDCTPTTPRRAYPEKPLASRKLRAASARIWPGSVSGGSVMARLNAP